MFEKQKIAVLGAGLMGHGIALVFAKAGHEVTVADPVPEMLNSVHERIRESLTQLGNENRAEEILSNVRLTESVPTAVDDSNFVIEAAPEKVELKQSIFKEVEESAPDDSIFATNTSVIQVSKIMQDLKLRNRALGTHWWNPPHMIPLVEVIKSEWTDQESASKAFELLKNIGKTPVMVEKDIPGFIGNRLQHALWREAISLVENNVCTAEDVDTVVKTSFGRRLAVLGPLENADLVGLELTKDIHDQVLFDLDNTPGSAPILRKLMDQGRNGMAAGAGFRNWNEGDLQKTKSKLVEHLIKLEAILPKQTNQTEELK